MTILYRCDGCEKVMDESETRFELSLFESEDEETEEYGSIDTEVPESEVEHKADHHFCSPSCVGAWAMDRALSEPEHN